MERKRRTVMNGIGTGVMGTIAGCSEQTTQKDEEPKPNEDNRNNRVDLHTHFIPDEYREYVNKHSSGGGGGVSLPKWSRETHISFMDEFGIRKSVVSLSSPGVYFGNNKEAQALARDVNNAAAELRDSNPSRFGAFATLPLPDIQGSLEEIHHSLDNLELDGVCLFSNYDGMYMGDPETEPILDELNRRGETIFLHPAEPAQYPKTPYPSSMVEFPFDTTRAVVHLLYSGTLEKYPKINWVLAHAGGTIPFLAQRVAGMSALVPELEEQVPKGVDHYLQNLYYDTAISATPEQMAATREIASLNQIVFGTDWPFTAATFESLKDDPAPHFQDIFTDSERKKIEQKNPRELIR